MYVSHCSAIPRLTSMKTVCQIHVVFMPRRFPGRCQENIPSAIQHCGLPRLKLADAECYNLILSDSSYPMSYFCSCLVRVKLQGIGPHARTDDERPYITIVKKEDPCGKGEKRLLARYGRAKCAQHVRKEMLAMNNDEAETGNKVGRQVLHCHC